MTFPKSRSLLIIERLTHLANKWEWSNSFSPKGWKFDAKIDLGGQWAKINYARDNQAKIASPPDPERPSVRPSVHNGFYVWIEINLLTLPVKFKWVTWPNWHLFEREVLSKLLKIICYMLKMLKLQGPWIESIKISLQRWSLLQLWVYSYSIFTLIQITKPCSVLFKLVCFIAFVWVMTIKRLKTFFLWDFLSKRFSPMEGYWLESW